MKTYVVTLVDINSQVHFIITETTLKKICEVFVSFFQVLEFVHRPCYSLSVIGHHLCGFRDNCQITADANRHSYDRVIYSFQDKGISVIENGKCIFVGDLKGFEELVQPEPLLGKTIVFRYTGGSEVGNRVIKVEKIDRKKGTVYYCGRDMAKGKYRCYDQRRIDGGILVVKEDGTVEAV